MLVQTSRRTVLLKRFLCCFACIFLILGVSFAAEVTFEMSKSRLALWIVHRFECYRFQLARERERVGTDSGPIVTSAVRDLLCNANFTFIVTSSVRRAPIMPMDTTPCLNYLQIDDSIYRVFNQKTSAGAGANDASVWRVNSSAQVVVLRTCRQYSVLCRSIDFFFLLQNVAQLFPSHDLVARDFVVLEDDVIPCESTFTEILAHAAHPEPSSRYDVPFVALSGWKALLLRHNQTERLRSFVVAMQSYLAVTPDHERSVDIDSFFRIALAGTNKGRSIFHEVSGEYVEHPLPTCMNGIMHTGSIDPVVCKRVQADFD
jgi:hypothetical protein